MSAQSIKWIKRGVICFYLLVIAALALYDEKPIPELARDMATPTPDVVEPGNAWIVFLGFDAAPGVAPYAHGEARMLKYRDSLRVGKAERPQFSEVDKSGLQFKGTIPAFHNKKDGGMTAFAAAHPEDIATLVRDNEELLQRYEGLCKYRQYNEALEAGYFAPVPYYATIKKACRVKLLQLACKACEGAVEPVLQKVREDAEFWRLVARSSNTLISKCVAHALLRIHLRFVADLAGSRQLSDKDLAIVRDILRPFDTDEVGFAKCLRGEFRYQQQSLLLTLRQADWWDLTTLICKPNATLNRLYEFWEASGIIRLAEMPPRQFGPERKKEAMYREGVGRIGIPFLYNPAGEIIVLRNTQSFPYYAPYIALGHDTEGLRRLSLLKVLSRAENIPTEGMQQFLDSHKAELGNPYTGGAMTWNSQKSSISFTTSYGNNTLGIIL
jgi:hypothetical protein